MEELFLLNRRYAATILGPARLVRFDAHRTLFAVGDRLHTAGADAERLQVVLHRIGTALTQTEVVFAGAALVAVTFDSHGAGRVLVQPRGLTTQDRLSGRLQVILVVVEVHGIADHRVEIFHGVRRRTHG